jgi:hypothetical protein
MLQLRKTLEQVLKTVAPRAVYPSALLRRSVQRRTSSEVMAGPFRGMKYLSYSTFGAYIPKLIGTYEREIAGALELELGAAPAHVIDVGGAEGYYAVGILTRLPQARVTVFEMSDRARAAIHELARLNGVSERLEVRGRCEPGDLEACLVETGATLVIMDVEGFEAELLSPAVCPHLAQANVLVEVHDFKVAGCSRRVSDHLAPTHRSTVFRQARRAAHEYPFRSVWGRLFPGAVLKYGLSEFRPPDNWWIWFQRKTVAHEASS